MTKLILASKSKVRKEILDNNNIISSVEPSNLDEDVVKESLLKEKASPELISKPENREQAMKILRKLNGKSHNLISSVCISKNGSMIWKHTDKATLTMKNMTENDLKDYLAKISDDKLFAYNVYQIEGEGRKLFSNIEGDENTIMGLPIMKIKEYLSNYN